MSTYILVYIYAYCNVINLKYNNTDVVYNYALLTAYVHVCI